MNSLYLELLEPTTASRPSSEVSRAIMTCETEESRCAYNGRIDKVRTAGLQAVLSAAECTNLICEHLYYSQPQDYPTIR